MWNLEWILKDYELHYINSSGRNDSVNKQNIYILEKNIEYLNIVNYKIIKFKLRPEVVEFVERSYMEDRAS